MENVFSSLWYSIVLRIDPYGNKRGHTIRQEVKEKLSDGYLNPPNRRESDGYLNSPYNRESVT